MGIQSDALSQTLSFMLKNATNSFPDIHLVKGLISMTIYRHMQVYRWLIADTGGAMDNLNHLELQSYCKSVQIYLGNKFHGLHTDWKVKPASLF